jgi:predicted  nucleic acid-binding Zn-ribbon protein
VIERRIAGRLRPVAARYRRLQFALTLATGWLGLALLGTLLWVLQRRYDWQFPGMVTAMWALGLLVLVVALIRSIRQARDYRVIAQRVESHFPELDARLLTAMQQQPQSGFLGGYSYLQEAVIRQALQHEARHAWYQVIPARRILGAHLACGLLFVYLAIVVAALTQSPQASLARSQPDWQSVPEGTQFEVAVEPGHTELERGGSLLVTARFTGFVPPDVELRVWNASGDEQRVPMKKSLDDPLFGVRVPDLREPVHYRVEFAEQTSEEYEVRLFEYPRLLRGDARLVYPSYTRLEPREIQDVRRVTAVEGTELTITCHLNKSVARATLVGRDQPDIELEPDSTDEHRYRATWQLMESGRYRLQLVDHEGREARSPQAEFVIRVSPNRQPDLKWTSPARDLRVSPLEEVALAGTVRDDFGILRYGIHYRIAGQSAQVVTLGTDVAGSQGEHFQYLLDLESLDAQPDQLVSYHLWAEDHGPDGEPRRTYSDMYFAEVRHFEEIFRQGRMSDAEEARQRQEEQDQQGAGGGEGERQAGELAELQKQIMTGTWNLIRRETGTEPTSEFTADVAVLNESQQSAHEQLEELEGTLQDPESLSYLDEARGYMQQAIQQLGEAASFSADALNGALDAEQAAYQALLRLRALEHEVVRSSRSSSSSSSSSSGSSSPSQQQLQQLELRDSENRYETERLAGDNLQDPAQREVRQAMNRLRELARRQGDLNERVKELQSALEQAADDEERRELERQLKRLRDEQQQILRDTEELQDRMGGEQLQEQAADAQRQLSETRENVREASEALEEGRLSQAVTSGTRAERDFQELQEELRQQASSQFEDGMREMRDRGRRLADQQGELREQLEQLTQEESRTLRGSTVREEMQDGLDRQRQELSDLLEQMRETIQEAEEAEPLLSRRLYDTFRRAMQDDPEEGLQQAAQWLREGIAEEAEAPLRESEQGVRRLAQGIDRAAESVLGDETEALRRASQELEQLANQLGEELGRLGSERESRGEGAGADQGDEDEESRQSGGRGAPGDREADSEEGEERRGSRGGDGELRDGERGDGEADADEDGAGGSGEPGSPTDRAGRPSGDGQDRGDRQPRDGEDERAEGRRGDSAREGRTEEGPSEDQEGDGESEGEESAGGSGRGGRGQEDSDPSGRGPNGRSQDRGSQDGRGTEEDLSESELREGGRSGGQLRDDAPRGTDREGSRRVSPGDGPSFDRSGGRGLEGLIEVLEDSAGAAPLTGDEFLEWSDRLRDVEEMLADPELRSETARIRDRARGVRMDLKRHSQTPNWDVVASDILQPLVELRDRVLEEARRRQGEEDLAPIDRDPVPAEFQEQVRRYYERLGRGR